MELLLKDVLNKVDCQLETKFQSLSDRNKELFLFGRYECFRSEETSRQNNNLISEVAMLEGLLEERKKWNERDQSKLIEKYKLQFERFKEEVDSQDCKLRNVEKQLNTALRSEVSLQKKVKEHQLIIESNLAGKRLEFMEKENDELLKDLKNKEEEVENKEMEIRTHRLKCPKIEKQLEKKCQDLREELHKMEQDFKEKSDKWKEERTESVKQITKMDSALETEQLNAKIKSEEVKAEIGKLVTKNKLALETEQLNSKMNIEEVKERLQKEIEVHKSNVNKYKSKSKESQKDVKKKDKAIVNHLMENGGLKEKWNDLNRQINDKDKKINFLYAKVQKVDEIMSANKAWKSKYENCRHENKKLKKKCEKENQKLKEMEARLMDFEREIEMEKEKIRNRMQGKVDDLQDRMITLRDENCKISSSENAVRDSKERLQKEFGEMKTKFDVQKKSFEDQRDKLDEMKRELDAFKKENKRLTELENSSQIKKKDNNGEPIRSRQCTDESNQKGTVESIKISTAKPTDKNGSSRQGSDDSVRTASGSTTSSGESLKTTASHPQSYKSDDFVSSNSSSKSLGLLSAIKSSLRSSDNDNNNPDSDSDSDSEEEEEEMDDFLGNSNVNFLLSSSFGGDDKEEEEEDRKSDDVSSNDSSVSNNGIQQADSNITLQLHHPASQKEMQHDGLPRNERNNDVIQIDSKGGQPWFLRSPSNLSTSNTRIEGNTQMLNNSQLYFDAADLQSDGRQYSDDSEVSETEDIISSQRAAKLSITSNHIYDEVQVAENKRAVPNQGHNNFNKIHEMNSSGKDFQSLQTGPNVMGSRNNRLPGQLPSENIGVLSGAPREIQNPPLKTPYNNNGHAINKSLPKSTGYLHNSQGNAFNQPSLSPAENFSIQSTPSHSMSRAVKDSDRISLSGAPSLGAGGKKSSFSSSGSSSSFLFDAPALNKTGKLLRDVPPSNKKKSLSSLSGAPSLLGGDNGSRNKKKEHW